jgi:predicted phage terminase large subunit-like protein
VSAPSAAAAAVHPVAWAAFAGAPLWRPARHLRWLGARVLELEQGKSLRLVVSMPPRHGKSEFLARHTPAWWLGRHPQDEVIYVTMQEQFSRYWSRKARDDFASHGESLWGVSCHPRASTKQWDVVRLGRRTGGSLYAVGAGGTITGKGARLLVVDDLIRNMAEARSETLREAQWEWFQSACLTRLTPDGRVVILMTRWHHDDLIGRLMRQQLEQPGGETWQFVNLPAIAGENDPLGRAPGEALWPERFPLEVLERRRREVGPIVWESLYQGRPTPLEGSILKKSWFRYYELGKRLAIVPSRGTAEVDRLHKFATVDLAASKKRRGDFTAIAVWGFHSEWKVLLLLDLVCERLGPERIVPTLLELREVHKPLNAFFVEREGPILEEKLGHVVKEAARAGVPVVELRPNGDKEARLIAATGAFAAEQVWFPRNALWLASYEEELLTFPEAKHDDRVDVTSYGVAAFNELLDGQNRLERERRDDQPDPGGNPWWTGSRGGDWR